MFFTVDRQGQAVISLLRKLFVLAFLLLDIFYSPPLQAASKEENQEQRICRLQKKLDEIRGKTVALKQRLLSSPYPRSDSDVEAQQLLQEEVFASENAEEEWKGKLKWARKHAPLHPLIPLEEPAQQANHDRQEETHPLLPQRGDKAPSSTSKSCPTCILF